MSPSFKMAVSYTRSDLVIRIHLNLRFPLWELILAFWFYKMKRYKQPNCISIVQGDETALLLNNAFVSNRIGNAILI